MTGKHRCLTLRSCSHLKQAKAAYPYVAKALPGSFCQPCLTLRCPSMKRSERQRP